MPQFIHSYTADNLRLLAVHWKRESDTCVVFTHGMSCHIIENYLAHVLGNKLHVGFIFGHNRGYSQINDICLKEAGPDNGFKSKRIGSAYEIFEECIHDIDLWIGKARELGYERIILMGHSLGCNKVIYHFFKKKPKVAGVILASPPDVVGLGKMKKYQPNYQELLEEAKGNVKSGQPRKLLSSLIWGSKILSSQTFLDLFQDRNPIDNLPLLRNPETFEQLACVNVPILAFVGEHDDIAIRTLQEDLDLIQARASNCPAFTSKIIQGSNHHYENKEEGICELVNEWVKSL